jgi:hypothetical protein
LRPERNYIVPVLAFLIVLIVQSSCEKFEGSQTVPAYISIDTFLLVPNSLLELGKLTHRITDVWVFVDDQTIGAFELPAERIPVLAEGKHKLTLYAGILYNGMSGTRGAYDFLEPAVYPEFNFIVDSIQKVNPSVKYSNTTIISWFEDFDDGTISLKPSTDSDTSLQFFPYEPPHPLLGNASGIGYLDAEQTVLEVASYNEDVIGIELPQNSKPVFLEMDYNIDNSLIVGLFVIEIGGQITQHPVVVLNPTGGEWRKVYVNLTPSVTNYYNADYFNVFFRLEKESLVGSSVIKLDNLKLLTK